MDYISHNKKIADDYNIICDEFNVSRVRIWNNVKLFLEKCNNGKLLDVGIGNGKNIINLNKNIKVIGIDISDKLLEICLSKNLEVYKKDVLELKPDDYGLFDNIISIAVIHHIENIELQKKAILNMIDCLNKNGNLLLSVWSYETKVNNENDLKKQIIDYRKFEIGPNYVDWNSKNKDGYSIKRFYYIHNYDSINNLLKDICKERNIEYKITWELQNWFCYIKLI